MAEGESGVALVSCLSRSVLEQSSLTATPLLSMRDTIKLSPAMSFTTNSKDCSVTMATKAAASDLLYCFSKSSDKEHHKACTGREMRSL